MDNPTTLDDLCPGSIPRFTQLGTLLLLTTALLGFALAAMISYHDMISARIRLVQLPPSVTLCARTSGRVTLLVQDGEEVDSGQYLAITENPARTEDMLVLKRLIAEEFDAAGVCTSTLPGAGLSLGQVQEQYARFETDLLDHRLLAEADFHKGRLALVRKKLVIAESAMQTLQTQEATMKEGYDIALQHMHSDSLLFAKGYISVAELSTRRMELLQKKQSLQAARSSVLLQESQVGELQRQVYDEAYRRSEDRKKSAQRVIASFKALETGFNFWEERHVVRSPCKGRVSFVRLLDNNGHFKPDDAVCTVVPENNRLVGRVIMESFASGKVAAGQSGRIEWDNYPYQEFGTIAATVQSIAIAPHEGKYLVLVGLTKGLVTDRGRELPFMEGMQGTIEIMTDRRTLLERLIDPVASVYRKAIQ